MWQAVLAGVRELGSMWLGNRRAKAEAKRARYERQSKIESDYDTEALRQSQYSLKDEFLAIVWFSPFVVAWWDPDLAMEWIDFVVSIPMPYWVGVFMIFAATFGARWFFKRETLTIAKEMVSKNGVGRTKKS